MTEQLTKQAICLTRNGKPKAVLFNSVCDQIKTKRILLEFLRHRKANDKAKRILAPNSFFISSDILEPKAIQPRWGPSDSEDEGKNIGGKFIRY